MWVRRRLIAAIALTLPRLPRYPRMTGLAFGIGTGVVLASTGVDMPLEM
jgi:hypothetical protein